MNRKNRPKILKRDTPKNAVISEGTIAMRDHKGQRYYNVATDLGRQMLAKDPYGLPAAPRKP